MGTHEASKALATVQEKPLNQTQLKNLAKLVEGDFDDLRQRLDADLMRRLSKRLEEINTEFDKQVSLDRAKAKLVEEGRKAEDRFRKVMDGLKAQGIDVKKDRYNRAWEITIDEDLLTQTGREQAIRKAKDAHRRLLTQVNQVISREERQVQRTVLLQGISSSGAMEIINDLPKSEDVMALVGSELQMDPMSQDDLKVLMTPDELAQAKALEKGDA